MRRRGLSNLALSKAIGVSHTSVGDWLKRGALPRPDAAARLARYLAIPIDALFDDKKEMPFDEHLRSVREDRFRVEAAYPENVPAQMHGLDFLQQERSMKKEAQRIRGIIGELAASAYALDNTDERMWALHLELKGKHSKT